jgi:hypothetical protein
VVFADVVHSMDIAAAVGAERLREIMAELVERCAAVVKRYGGMVDKFTDDGIMAVFGAPAALEDHAVPACLAAMAVQEEANRLADGSEPDGDQRAGSEFERLRGVDLPSGDLPRLNHERLHLGIAIYRLLDLAEPGPVLGGDEHGQSVRLLPADHGHQQGDVLPAVLLDDLDRLLELPLQLVPDLARPWADRHRVNNRHIP